MLTKFKEEAKKFTMLYVYEEGIELPSSFYSHFKEVLFTSKYERALELFDKNSIDIVLMDSFNQAYNQKYFMDEIRKKQYDIPIVALSDKTDTDTLLNALELKITKYIAKPITLDNIIKVFYELILTINEKQDAKKQYKIIGEKKLKSSIDMVTKELLISLPYPMAVFSKDKVIYSNKEFNKLLKHKGIDISKDINVEDVESIFENKKGFFTKINNLSEHKNFDKKFYYEYDGEIKIFIPNKESLNLPASTEENFLITLNNVYPLIAQTAMITYQKNKIQTYNELLEDILTKKVFSSNEAIVHVKTKDTEKIETKKTFDDNLNDKDIGILRRSRDKKYISSKEYLSSLDKTIMQDIHDLSGTQEELLDLVIVFDDNPELEIMTQIINQLSTYTSIINSLIEFSDLSNAIGSLVNFLSELDSEILIDRKDEISEHLNNFTEDLISWRKNIFLSEDTLDIHYLDSSLFSSSLQFQIMLSNEKESELDDGDFELF